MLCFCLALYTYRYFLIIDLLCCFLEKADNGQFPSSQLNNNKVVKVSACKGRGPFPQNNCFCSLDTLYTLQRVFFSSILNPIQQVYRPPIFLLMRMVSGRVCLFSFSFAALLSSSLVSTLLKGFIKVVVHITLIFPHSLFLRH